MSGSDEEAEDGTDELAPWRAWVHARDARMVVGERSAWSVEVEPGLRVALEVVPEGRGVASVRVTVPLPESLAGLSMVGVEHAIYKRGRAFTGDARFDDQVVMHVPSAALFGALDAGTRWLIGGLVERGVIAAGGALRLEPWASSMLPPDAVGPCIAEMIDLARALAIDPQAAREGIAMILETDPNPAVRDTYERAFGAAPDIRDARAEVKRRLADDTERYGLLAQQVRDPSLGLIVRRDACLKLVHEFALTRCEEVIVGLPPKLAEGLVEHVLMAIRHATDPAEARAGARLGARRAWRALARTGRGRRPQPERRRCPSGLVDLVAPGLSRGSRPVAG